MEIPKIFAAEASDSEHFGMDGKVAGAVFFEDLWGCDQQNVCCNQAPDHDFHG